MVSSPIGYTYYRLQLHQKALEAIKQASLFYDTNVDNNNSNHSNNQNEKRSNATMPPQDYRKSSLARCYCHMGNALQFLIRREEALVYYQKALEENPLLPNVHCGIALIYEGKVLV